jgi:hypothetical protein
MKYKNLLIMIALLTSPLVSNANYAGNIFLSKNNISELREECASFTNSIEQFFDKGLLRPQTMDMLKNTPRVAGEGNVYQIKFVSKDKMYVELPLSDAQIIENQKINDFRARNIFSKSFPVARQFLGPLAPSLRYTQSKNNRSMLNIATSVGSIIKSPELEVSNSILSFKVYGRDAVCDLINKNTTILGSASLFVEYDLEAVHTLQDIYFAAQEIANKKYLSMNSKTKSASIIAGLARLLSKNPIVSQKSDQEFVQDVISLYEEIMDVETVSLKQEWQGKITDKIRTEGVIKDVPFEFKF